MNIKVMLFAKAKNIFCDYAQKILRTYFKDEEILCLRGEVGDYLDEELKYYKPDYVISFVSPWIIPKEILESAKIAALNFHPGSPQYPGTGCYNFALYEQSKQYGVTVHHMKEKVDTGDIVMTSYFNVSRYDTVETLKLKSMYHLLFLFEKVLDCIASGCELPISDEKWTRKPFTRREMYELFKINPTEQDECDIKRRIRAAEYPGCKGAYIEAGNKKFYCEWENRNPIVL